MENNGENKCETCQKSFDSKDRLKTHKSKMHGKRTYFCTECDYKSKRKSHVSRHISSAHREKSSNIQCNICLISLKNKKTYNKHIKTHEEAAKPMPSWKCLICREHFKTANEFNEHISMISSRSMFLIAESL